VADISSILAEEQAPHSIDVASDTWLAIRDWANGRLKMRRGNLEVVGLDMSDTENQRGAVEELKELLGLVETRDGIES